MVTDMAPASRIRDTLEVEVFLFGGVPERPEPVYGRDSHANVETRTTRSPIARSAEAGANVAGASLGRFSINVRTGEMFWENSARTEADGA
jgi:hypothetical protein